MEGGAVPRPSIHATFFRCNTAFNLTIPLPLPLRPSIDPPKSLFCPLKLRMDFLAICPSGTRDSLHIHIGLGVRMEGHAPPPPKTTDSLYAGRSFLCGGESNPERVSAAKKNNPGDCFLGGWCAGGYRFPTFSIKVSRSQDYLPIPRFTTRSYCSRLHPEAIESNELPSHRCKWSARAAYTPTPCPQRFAHR